MDIWVIIYTIHITQGYLQHEWNQIVHGAKYWCNPFIFLKSFINYWHYLPPEVTSTGNVMGVGKDRMVEIFCPFALWKSPFFPLQSACVIFESKTKTSRYVLPLRISSFSYFLMRKGFGLLTFALLEQTTVKQNSFQFLYYLNSIFDEFLIYVLWAYLVGELFIKILEAPVPLKCDRLITPVRFCFTLKSLEKG